MKLPYVKHDMTQLRRILINAHMLSWRWRSPMLWAWPVSCLISEYQWRYRVLFGFLIRDGHGWEREYFVTDIEVWEFFGANITVAPMSLQDEGDSIWRLLKWCLGACETFNEEAFKSHRTRANRQSSLVTGRSWGTYSWKSTGYGILERIENFCSAY